MDANQTLHWPPPKGRTAYMQGPGQRQALLEKRRMYTTSEVMWNWTHSRQLRRFNAGQETTHRLVTMSYDQEQARVPTT